MIGFWEGLNKSMGIGCFWRGLELVMRRMKGGVGNVLCDGWVK